MKRLQNKIARSRLSLPLTALIALVVWGFSSAIEHRLWMQFTCFVFSSYLMVELNTTFVLLRTYSRMVSCAFLAQTCAANFLFSDAAGGIVSLCIVAGLMSLFKTYQDRLSTGWTFSAFVPLGVASLLWVQALFFLPLSWIVMWLCLRSMSMRTFGASVFGVIVPYWFAGLYFVFTEDIATPLAHFESIIEFGPIFGGVFNKGIEAIYPTIGLDRWLSLLFTVILATTGIVHYLRRKNEDKVNTRMYYDTFITFTIASVVYLLLQPQHFDMAYRMLVINTSPLIAHYITHTRTMVTNLSFIAMLCGIVALTVVNIII